MARRARHGFTLLEFLVCVSIAGLLAALALPGYRQHLRVSRRLEAREALLRVQALQERHYFQHGRYASSLEELAADALRDERRFYRVELRAEAGGQRFTAVALPVGSQARDRDCVELSLDDSGRRDARGAADAATRCWS